MSYYLREIDFAAIGASDTEPVKQPDHKKLVARCSSDDVNDCDFLQQIVELKSPSSIRAALSALHKLVNVAASGQPFTDFYDKKQCHEIHSFEYKHKAYKIWRIRKSDLRITFYYAEGKAVLLTHVFEKHRDKLTSGQEAMLETEVKAYIDALEVGAVEMIESEI